jgi:hypothetical protein
MKSTVEMSAMKLAGINPNEEKKSSIRPQLPCRDYER